MKLTAKQEAFAVKYVECNDASEAYRLAYDAEKITPNSVHVNASKQLKHAKVALRIKELQKQVKKIADEKFTVSVEQRLRWLHEIALAGMSKQVIMQGESMIEKRENLPASNKAIEILNAMLGTDEHNEVKPVKVFVGVEDASKS